MLKKKLASLIVATALTISTFASSVYANEINSNNDLVTHESIPQEFLNDNSILDAVNNTQKIADELIKDLDRDIENLHEARTFGINDNCQDYQLFKDGVYSIKLKDSNYFVDVIYGKDYNGNGVHSWDLNYSNSQLWRLIYAGNGEYIILNQLSGKSLEIQNSNNFNGAKIQIWNYGGIPTQRWRIEPVRDKHGNFDGSVKFVNVNSEKCLDIIGSRQVKENKFHAWENVDVPSQKYKLIKRF